MQQRYAVVASGSAAGGGSAAARLARGVWRIGGAVLLTAWLAYLLSGAFSVNSGVAVSRSPGPVAERPVHVEDSDQRKPSLSLSVASGGSAGLSAGVDGGDLDGSAVAGGPLLQSGPYRVNSFVYRIPGISQQHLDHASQCLGVWAYQRVLNRHLFFRPHGTGKPSFGHVGASLPPAVAALDVPQAILDEPQDGGVGDYTRYPDIAAGGDDVGTVQWVSFADPRWNDWFRNVFWPAVFSTEALASVASNPSRPGIHYTCGNVLLENAPWCGMFSHEFSSFLYQPTEVAKPLLREYEDVHAAGGKMVRRVIPSEVLGGELPTRPELVRRVKEYFSTTSRRGQLNERDKKAIEGIRWRAMGRRRGDDDPVPISLDAVELANDRAAGEVFLWRTRQKYPILLALRKSDRPADSQANRFKGTFDAERRLHGLHACFFGEMRNLSETIGSLEHDVMRQFRPMRTHFVTNDNVSQTSFVWKPTTEPVPLTMSPEERSNLGFLRKIILENYTAQIFHLADTFLVTAGALHRVPTNCHHCRGALTKEMCRMSILSDLDRGYPVEFVLIFRPDAIIRLPFRLFVTVGQREVNLNVTEEVQKVLEDPENNAQPPSSMRLFAPEYRFSIVTDGGVTPAAMGLVSDVSFDPQTIDKYSGEWNQRTFFRDYLRPLFRLGFQGRAPDVAGPIQLRPFDFMISLFRPHPLKNKVIFSTNVKYAPYQEQTYFKKFALRWQYAECMYYSYAARQTNVTVIFPKERFFFRGSVGKIKMTKVPMQMCSLAAVPPSIQNCFVQYQRMFYYKKGSAVNNPCKPYCNVFPIFMPEGLCLSIGTPSARNKNHATFSETPMWRNESGEVLKFNVVTPQHLIGDQAYKDRERAKMVARLLQQQATPISNSPQAAASSSPSPPSVPDLVDRTSSTIAPTKAFVSRYSSYPSPDDASANPRSHVVGTNKEGRDTEHDAAIDDEPPKRSIQKDREIDSQESAWPAAPGDPLQGFTFARPNGFGDSSARVDDEKVRRDRSAAMRSQGLNQPPKKYRTVKKGS